MPVLLLIYLSILLVQDSYSFNYHTPGNIHMCIHMFYHMNDCVVVYSISQPGIRWDDETSLDIACPLTHTQAKDGGPDKHNFFFIRVRTL